MKLEGKRPGMSVTVAFWTKHQSPGFADLRQELFSVAGRALCVQGKKQTEIGAEANVSASVGAGALRRQRQANASWQILQKSISVQRNLFCKGHRRLRAISHQCPNLLCVLLIGPLQLQVRTGNSPQCKTHQQTYIYIYIYIMSSKVFDQYGSNTAKSEWRARLRQDV